MTGVATTCLGLIGAIGLGAIMRTTGEFDPFLTAVASSSSE